MESPLLRFVTYLCLCFLGTCGLFKRQGRACYAVTTLRQVAVFNVDTHLGNGRRVSWALYHVMG